MAHFRIHQTPGDANLASVDGWRRITMARFHLGPADQRDARTGRAAPAAPAGGAGRRYGRGCGLIIAVAAIAGAGSAQQVVTVPSGQAVTLNEVLVEDTGKDALVRFRFVAPAIAREGGTVDYDAAAADIDHLCRDLVIPYMAEFALTSTQVVISMSDRDVPFGDSNPQATQFFEAYRLEGADCIWEAF